MLMGLVKQGLQCKRCTRNFHKRCVYLLKECTPKPDDECSSEAFSSSESLIQQHSTDSSVFNGSGVTNMSVPHHWVVHSYRLPTVCQYCNKLLIGLIRQGLRCKDCKYNAHRQCKDKIGENCRGDLVYIPTNSESNASTIVNDFSNTTLEEEQPAQEGPLSDQMIPVQRLCVSIRRTHRSQSKIIKQGWLSVKFTQAEKLGLEPLPCFAILSYKNITFYEKEVDSIYLKDLPLNDIHFLETETNEPDALFDIHTNHGLLTVFPHADKLDMTKAEEWSDAIVSAMMPVYNNEERKYRSGSVKRSTGSSFTGSRRKKPAIEQMSAPKIEKRDISEVYQIFVDDMVGSGQFGAVYGAIQRETGRKAAVKVIKKEQFGQQRRSIENEVKILKCAQYPCIVEMMNTFETDGKLFVVMERMHSDMLELILSSSQGRLDERTTQLMMIQIMMALKYLHSMDIAHCDLKPENVLLAEDSNMPLIKLCDFGYARIIDQSQFRQSMVGTPAYLAPEVISHANWDRNIDVWAAGVVLYVTLSGTFPFNEEEDICDQIENASFMYPPNPWKQISHDAIELLNCLLVVNPTDRYNVNRCLQHNFLSNKTVLNDLKALETRHNISLAID